MSPLKKQKTTVLFLSSKVLDREHVPSSLRPDSGLKGLYGGRTRGDRGPPSDVLEVRTPESP